LLAGKGITAISSAPPPADRHGAAGHATGRIEFAYHAFITDRHGDMLELEADHRRHAEIENVIRDLKYGVGLNYLPSGRAAGHRPASYLS
jgi:hypothetical protein